MPGDVHVDHEARDAVVLRALGVGAREQDAPARFLRHRRPHLLAVDDPAAVDALRTRREAREIGSRARFAEELAPDHLAAQRRHDPARLLLGRAVDDEVRQRPRADHDPRPHDLRGAELLLDHEQLERGCVASPRLRPRRADVALVDEAIAARLRVERTRSRPGTRGARSGGDRRRRRRRRCRPRAAGGHRRARGSRRAPAPAARATRSSWCSVIARRR